MCVLRFMSGDYKVTMQIIGDGEAIAKFENQDTDVTYVVGSDADAR